MKIKKQLRFKNPFLPVFSLFLYLATVLLIACSAHAEELAKADLASKSSSSGPKRSAAEVAKELANPNTTLGFLAFLTDYITYDGDLPGSSSKDALKFSFQPSLPYPLGEGENLFFRPLIPLIIDQPVPDSTGFSSEGADLGDIGFDIAYGKSFPSGLQLIGGMVGSVPSATNDDLGLGEFTLGPEAFIGHKMDWGFVGMLVSHQWDVAGSDTVSITGGQYFYTINLEDAWQIQGTPTWSYNHQASSSDRLDLPLGTGISKTVVFGETPIKFSVQYWYHVVSPDTFGPDHQVRFQIAPVIPLPW